jgi:hypothetical protein
MSRRRGPRAPTAVAAVLLAALAGAACTDLTITRPVDAITAPIANPSLARDIQPILTATCAASNACHAGPTPQRGMSLEAGRSWANLVNVPSASLPPLLRVEPGQPDSSALLIRLDTNSTARRGLPRMPLTTYPLPDPVIQTIRNWIANGAPNN